MTIKGTYKYMDPHNNHSCDYYSLCSMAYELLSGDWLPNISFSELKQKGRPTFPENIPLGLKKVLLSGFEENIDDRATWDVAITAISKFHLCFA